MTKRSFSGNTARVVGGFSAAAVALSTFVFSPVQLSAQSRGVQIPDELCSFQPLPGDMIETIRAREDFPAILEYLSAQCPEVALSLAGPTASIPTTVAFGDNNGFAGPRGSTSAGAPPSASSGGSSSGQAGSSSGETSGSSSGETSGSSSGETSGSSSGEPNGSSSGQPTSTSSSSSSSSTSTSTSSSTTGSSTGGTTTSGGSAPKPKNNSGLGNNDEDGGVGCKDKTCYDNDNRGKNKVVGAGGRSK